MMDKLGESLREGDLNSEFNVAEMTPEYEVYEDKLENPASIFEIDDMVGHERYDPEGYESYITAQVLLPRGDEFKIGTVVRRHADRDGNPQGISDKNPILDTRKYEVEFNDGEVLEYAANVIAENLYSQIDEEGKRHVLFDSIIDHKEDRLITGKVDTFVENQGKRERRMTTEGWKLCVQWKDGSTSWELLNAWKESNPLEVAEYASARKLSSKPAFAWWVPFTLKKTEKIVAACSSCYLT